MENKKMKLWKKMLLVILVIFILFAIHTIRNFIVISNIVNLSKEYATKTNYIANVYSIQSDSVNILKSYNKDRNYLTTIEAKVDNIDETKRITKYRYEDDSIAIIQSGNKKIAVDEENVLGNVQVVTFSYGADMNLIEKLLLSAMTKISTDKCNDKECFYIQMTDNWKIWVDKENGTIIRDVDNNFVTVRNYEFDIVTEENIVKPDISDCEIQK